MAQIQFLLGHVRSGRRVERDRVNGVGPCLSVAVGDVTYVGTDDGRVLCVGADGALEQLRGFDATSEELYPGFAAKKVR